MRYYAMFTFGAVAGAFQFHSTIIALALLTLIDIISGVIKAVVNKTVSSDASWRGMVKKSFAFLLVATGWIGQNLLQVSFPFDLHVAIAGAFCFTEVISIFENAKACGITIPDWLIEGFQKKKVL